MIHVENKPRWGDMYNILMRCVARKHRMDACLPRVHNKQENSIITIIVFTNSIWIHLPTVCSGRPSFKFMVILSTSHQITSLQCSFSEEFRRNVFYLLFGPCVNICSGDTTRPLFQYCAPVVIQLKKRAKTIVIHQFYPVPWVHATCTPHLLFRMNY